MNRTLTFTPEELSSLSQEYLAEDHHGVLLDTNIVFTVLVTVTYILFNISRGFYAGRNGWEIWTLYPFSYICCLGICILTFCKHIFTSLFKSAFHTYPAQLPKVLTALLGLVMICIGGVGRHRAYWELNDPAVFLTYLKLQTALEFIYMANVTFPKICLLILYLRIVEGKVKLITKITLGVVITNYIVSIITIVLLCRPFAYNWDKTIDGNCANLMGAFRYASLPNIVTDIAIVAIPFPMLYKLQVSRERKVGLLVTFLAGGLGIFTAIARFVEYMREDWTSDPTYGTVRSLVLGIIEPDAYFICSCLPGMRPLVRGLYRKFVSSRNTVEEPRGDPRPPPPPMGRKGYDSSVSDPFSSYKTSISALQRPNDHSEWVENPAVIQLDKTVQVDYSRALNSPGDIV
ncbi:hypothetical protein F4811DRAFT_84836 [Daldinia bambusicola]|nr:hypothetical protein F4811DRAFT_84836 [Daldinia bambusicola]